MSRFASPINLKDAACLLCHDRSSYPKLDPHDQLAGTQVKEAVCADPHVRRNLQEPDEDRPKRLQVTFALLAIAVSTVIAYYPGMSAGFYFDQEQKRQAIRQLER